MARAVVVDLVAQHLRREPAEIHDDDLLVEGLGVDSLGATELLVALFDRTGVRLRVPDVDELGTVGDVVDRLVLQTET